VSVRFQLDYGKIQKLQGKLRRRLGICDNQQKNKKNKRQQRKPFKFILKLPSRQLNAIYMQPSSPSRLRSKRVNR
jgi:hypothetical protein